MAIDYNNLVDSQFKKKPEDSNWGSMDYLPGYLTGLRKKKPVINVNKYDANPNGTTQNDVIPNQPVIRESADTGTSQPNFNVPKMSQPTIPVQPGIDSYNEYWKTPVVGKMPLDQFVQMAGMLSNSLAPDTPMGRLGGELYKQGSIVSAERARREYEAPEKNLRTRLLNAQINQAEQKAPEAWDSVYNALNNTINPKTKKLYTLPEIIKDFETAKAIPKERGFQSDIGKLQADKESLMESGFAEDHPAIKAIDSEMGKKSTTTERDMKAYFTSSGEVDYLPNNVKPPKGYIPYAKEPTASTKEPRELKPFITSSGEIDYLPNNIKPPKGYKPYSKEQEKQPQLTMPEAKALSEAAKNYESSSESDRSIAEEVAAQNGLAIVKKTSVEKKAWYNPSRYGKNDTFEKSNYVLVKKNQSTNGTGPKAKIATKPPEGFKDSNRTSGGKKVYIKGNQAWVEP